MGRQTARRWVTRCVGFSSGLAPSHTSPKSCRCRAVPASIPDSLPTTSEVGPCDAGGCDEGCQAYVRVALVDPTSNAVVEGFSAEQMTAFDVNSLNLPLLWAHKSAESLAGRQVKALVQFRDAVVYGLTVG